MIVGGAAALAAVAALALPGVQTVEGLVRPGRGDDRRSCSSWARSPRSLAGGGDDAPLRLARPLALGALVLLLAGTVIAAASGGQGPASSTEAERLVSTQSNRSAYWRVAAEVFAEHPLNGIGSGSFGVEWLERREIAEARPRRALASTSRPRRSWASSASRR